MASYFKIICSNDVNDIIKLDKYKIIIVEQVFKMICFFHDIIYGVNKAKNTNLKGRL